jgi:predicted porin
MKKSLFAVAAVTAFAGAAQAQSSVTVYGIMDAGYVGGSTRVASGTAVGKSTVNQFNSSAESTSRLGFKGTEDLGGGMSAFFTIELGLAPADSTSGFKNASTTENRQSFVGLKKNGLGDFAVGTQYTVVHNAVSATDAAGTNNILGDMIYTSSTGIAQGATNTTVSEGYGNGQSYTIRAQNTLTVNTDTFAGFKGHAMAVMNNKNYNQSTLSGSNGYTGGTNNQNGWGLGVDYTLHGLYATVAYQAFSAKEAYDLSTTYTASPSSAGVASKSAAGTPGYVAFGEGQASTLGNNVKDNQFYAAATYDFGILKAYAQYLNRKVTSQLDSGYYLKRTGEQIGVRSYITPTIEAWAQGGMGKYTAFGSNNPAANLVSWQIGSNYWLSKRTNLYAIYGQVGTTNVSTLTTAGVAQNPASANASNYAVGVRHTF